MNTTDNAGDDMLAIAAPRAYTADFGAPLPEVSFDAARDNSYCRPDRAR